MSAEVLAGPGSAGAARARTPLFQRLLLGQFALLASIALGLAAVEAYFRIDDARDGRGADFYLPKASPGQAIYRPHAFLGAVLVPGAERPGAYHWKINALGMRGEEMAREKPPGTYRVFCLGGSTVFGTGCTHHRFTWPAQMQETLNSFAPSGRRYEVGNAGVPGWTSVESLIDLELRLLELAPDAIVLYHGANDARPVQARGFEPDYSHVRRAWVESPISPLETFLLRHVRTYARIARGTDPEKQAGALNEKLFVPGYKELHVPSSQGVVEEGIRVYVRNLENTIAVARRAGVLPVLSTFAYCKSKLKPGEEWFFETVDRMNEETAKLAEREDLPLIRVAEEFSEKPELFDDWMHMNDKGSSLHGRFVAESARELGLFGLAK